MKLYFSNDVTRPWYINGLGFGFARCAGVSKRPSSQVADSKHEWLWSLAYCNDGKGAFAFEDMWCSCEYDQHVDRQPPLLLRGLCPSSFLRTVDPERGLRYTLRQMPRNLDTFFLVGGMSTRIEYSDARNQWNLAHATSNVRAVSLARKDTNVVGKHNWTITNDHKWCREGNEKVRQTSYKMQLKLSACKNDEFTCNNGQCVLMEERCDQMSNCLDGSDEDGCKLLILMKGYNKNIPPLSFVNLVNKTIVPVAVNVSLRLLKVVSIAEVKNSIDLQFEIMLEWTDDRITYNNLKQKTYLNALTYEDIRQVWLPLVVFANTNQRETSRLGSSWEWSTSVSVTRQGSFNRYTGQMMQISAD